MLDFWRSTIGKKIIVAISGGILLIYVFLHMIGNLNSLWGSGGGEEARVNWYAEWLRDFGEPLLPHSSLLWVIRAILLSALIIHVTGVVQLTRRNRAARPAQYPAKRIKRSFSSITMMVTGLFLLIFIVFHILQFTSLTIDVTPLREGDVYANLYYAFHKWYFVVIYLAAVTFLGFHLRHAIWSLCQTLGLDSPSRNAQIRIAATGLSILLVIGFALVPVLFTTDVLDAPETTTAMTHWVGSGVFA